MPTLISRGAASARGFGLTGGVTNLTTVTFTSSGTWVAPSMLSLVNVLTGKGQDGEANDYWTDLFAADGGYVTYVQSNAVPGTSSSLIESRAQTEWDKFPTVHDPNGAVVDWLYWYYGSFGTAAYDISALVRLKSGFSKTKEGGGWGTTYTTPPSSDKGYRVGNMEQYVYPTTGANSSALGYTFNGGVAGPASPATYTNIPVTPSASYSIVVPAGGYVIIQYLL